MILETNNTTINLVFRIKKIVDISSILKTKNFEEGFVKAYSECDYDSLSKIIYILAENEDGKKVFASSDKVYDFLDELRVDKQINANEVYKMIAEALNEEGFFKNKKSKKELEEMTSNPLSTMNMNELIKNSTQKAMEQIATEQFQGYMG